MKEPEKITHTLIEKCPICKANLYTYWHTPASDQPELGTWHIECTKCGCTYRGSFINLEEVQKEFTLIEKP